MSKTAPRIGVIHLGDLSSKAANLLQTIDMCRAFDAIGSRVTLVTGAPSVDEQKVAQMGLSSVDIRYRGSLSRKSKLFKKIASAVICRQIKPQFVLTRDLTCAYFCAAFHVPTILEFHDLPNGRAAGFLFKRLKRSKYFCGSIAITQSLETDLRCKWPDFFLKKASIVCSDAVDLGAFESMPSASESRRMIGFKEGQFVASYIGNLYAGKGVEVVLPTAELLPDVQFVVVGGPAERTNYWKQECERRGIANIKFVEFVPRVKLKNYYSASNCVLLPNQVKVEGNSGGDIGKYTSPLKMFEYLACGRPMIASDLPVLREVLTDSMAIMCAHDSPSEWAEAISRLMCSSELCSRLVSSSLEIVQQFTWQNRAKTIVEFASEHHPL